ncbi:MAG: glycosyltransferase family 1 protein, partial [Synechococcaceae bacterium WB9_2_112]|nr:glycosyltransferase family 1 protein [Synechococcaceae bacterium WB9_2_112]
MSAQAVLFHYGSFQPLWQQPGLIQCGPRLVAGEGSVPVAACTVEAIQQALIRQGHSAATVLIHYTDPFLIRAAPLRGLNRWRGPRLLVCGDLHHGPAPIDTLQAYLGQEFHDAVLLAFNPMLLGEVQRRLAVPVHCHPPGFFRYPRCQRQQQPARRLVHVGSLGPHHPGRRALVEALQQRGRIPFLHCTTESPEQAAEVYAANALVLNIPLNNDLNHRFYEAMAAGAP